MWTIFVELGVPVPDKYERLEAGSGRLWFNGFMIFITGELWVFWLLFKVWRVKRSEHNNDN